MLQPDYSVDVTLIQIQYTEKLQQFTVAFTQANNPNNHQ